MPLFCLLMYSESFEIDTQNFGEFQNSCAYKLRSFTFSFIEALPLDVNLIIIIYTTSKVPSADNLRFLSMKLQTFWREISSV